MLSILFFPLHYLLFDSSSDHPRATRACAPDAFKNMLASMMRIVRALNEAHFADSVDILTELLQAVFRADDKDKVSYIGWRTG